MHYAQHEKLGLIGYDDFGHLKSRISKLIGYENSVDHKFLFKKVV
jgi:hypothetical protein